MPFRVLEPEVEELEQGPAGEVAIENARRKARDVAHRSGTAGPVLGVDTVVSLDGRIYGKPADAERAGDTLRALSGRRHLVVSGICVVSAGREQEAVASTGVEFREFDDSLLAWYLSHGEWRGRAGGYAIQGRGAALVKAIDGDYLNVVGLPVAALLELAPWVLSTTA